jgi:hypothetical protein
MYQPPSSHSGKGTVAPHGHGLVFNYGDGVDIENCRIWHQFVRGSVIALGQLTSNQDDP